MKTNIYKSLFLLLYVERKQKKELNRTNYGDSYWVQKSALLRMQVQCINFLAIANLLSIAGWFIS